MTTSNSGIVVDAGPALTFLARKNTTRVLHPGETGELSSAVQRLCMMPMSEWIQQGKDLGELMVIAHADTALARQKAARFRILDVTT